VIFAKEPVAGRVKTRLLPSLTPAEAAAFAAACLLDLTRRLERSPARRVVALPPDSSAENVRRLVGPRWEIVDQGAGDLGEKLARVTAEEFAADRSPVLVVGADHPHLPLASMESAMAAAAAGSVGWVPTMDGGYACIALPRPMPEIFAGVPWSTPRVAEVTRNNADLRGVHLTTLGPWYDLDTAEDLDRFLEDPASAGTCPATWRALTTLEPVWAKRRMGRG
jgi:rSAM/selenodomain-associated transferase 1